MHAAGKHRGRYVPPRIYRQHVGVSEHQLRWWAKAGKIDFVRTPGGNRLYRLDDREDPEGDEAGPPKIAYCRVSSSKQRPDLERQQHFMAQRFPDFKIVSDVGSGINWKRPGLLAVLDGALDGSLKELAVANRDRLCRFAFELVEHVLRKHGVKLVVVDDNDATTGEGRVEREEQDLADDLLSIVQVFCCRRNGRRRYARGGGGPQDPENQAEPDAKAEAEATEVQ